MKQAIHKIFLLQKPAVKQDINVLLNYIHLKLSYAFQVK